MRLTKATIAKIVLPPGKSDLLVFDDALPGFALRVRAGGKRTWIAQYRIGTKQRRLSLGSTEAVDADEARRRAKSALSKVQLGVDPQSEKQAGRAQASITLKPIIESFLSRRARGSLKPRSFHEVERHLLKHWAPLHESALQKIDRAEIASRLAVIALENGPFAANRARASISTFFSWCVGEGLVDINPVVGTNKATDEISRDRVLSAEELSLVWQHAGSGQYGEIVRLLILTDQRREEVGGMLWSELDLDAALWSIGGDRTKNGLPHDVPLSAAAVGILRAHPRRDGRDLVFGAGDGPFSGWSNAKARLDADMLEAVRKKQPDASIKPWRLHDIRRTVATRLGDQGVLPHVVEAILNHVSGSKAGVAGIYNRAVYAAEKRAALDAWAAVVLVNGGGGK